jgi:hypothetical protein
VSGVSGREEERRIYGHTHLSVLFIASEQHVGRRLEGKGTILILADDGRWGDVRLALRRWRWGGLRIKVSDASRGHKNEATSDRGGGSLNHS